MNALKQIYIDRVKQHQDADEIAQGVYYATSGGKLRACCVGCAAHTNKNAYCELEIQTNIPEWLSRLADRLHEGLTEEESKHWPLRFISAVPEQIFTKEWSAFEINKKIKAPFLIVVLQSALETFDHHKFPRVKAAIEGSIAIWQRDDIGSQEWKAAAYAAADAAYAAARAAVDAAARATYAAARATYAAARATYAAARATYAAADAAYAAAYAAADAAYAAYAAYAAVYAAAYASARADKYKYFSDQLVKVMESAA